MSELRNTAAALAALLTVLGCSADPVKVRVRAFEHPEDVAFVCFGLGGGGQALPLSSCAGSADDPNVALHALVTQGGRGQVAVVDLDGDDVLDADIQVPGFTFFPVGEIPSEIVVPEQSPELTFVSDIGSLDVIAIETRRLRFGAGEPGEPFVRIPLPAAPSDLALSPDESRLYAALPTLGAVAVITLSEVAIGAAPPTPTLIALGSTVPAPVAAIPTGSEYCRVCGVGDSNPVGCETLLDPWPTGRFSGRLLPPSGTDPTGSLLPEVPRGLIPPAPAPFEPREPVSAGVQPAPVAFTVDHDNDRILVADASLPLVHVIQRPAEPGDDLLLEPIVTAVPTDGIALTPRVPAVIDGVVDPADPASFDRYLYAIDATDRSVMALRYDEATPSGSAVLPVNARGSAATDRIRLPAGARVIDVITPEYPDRAGDAAAVRCAAGTGQQADAGPQQLRGVFLVAGLLNGRLEVVDVYDLDAECRGGIGCSGPGPTNPEDAIIYLRRHRPRIGSEIRAGLDLLTPPTFDGDRGFFVAQPGEEPPAGAPGLVPFGVEEGEDGEDEAIGCGAFQSQVFPPGGGEPLVCVQNDPWATETETWLATWEGAIPGTRGGRGRFADVAAGEFLVEIPVCGRGVLGRDNIAAVDAGRYESLYQPDLLAITGTLPPSTEDREDCQRLLDDDVSGGGLVEIEIPILRAERREVDGDPQHVLTLADGPRGLGVTLGDLAACFPELVSYEIRSQGAYTVLGGRTGFQHRVTVDEATGLCTVDPSLAATRVGKALPDVLFDNGLVRFRIREPDPPLGAQSAAEMTFQIGQVPSKLSIPISEDLPTILSDVDYSEMDARLYVVDTQFRGLVRIQVAPVRVLQSFE